VILRDYRFLTVENDDERRQLLFVGFADSSGKVEANTRLSARRAGSVRDALEFEHLRASAIGRGEEVRPSGLLFENPRSRRVDVYFCDPDAQ
jgi:outer membrane protein OmpA-like peptidoglycan-associated protein